MFASIAEEGCPSRLVETRGGEGSHLSYKASCSSFFFFAMTRLLSVGGFMLPLGSKVEHLLTVLTEYLEHWRRPREWSSLTAST